VSAIALCDASGEEKGNEAGVVARLMDFVQHLASLDPSSPSFTADAASLFADTGPPVQLGYGFLAVRIYPD
jgi:hypothetical protein